MASNARKELSRALKAAFTDSSGSSFEDHEPSHKLLDAVEAYCSSSDIAAGQTERDTLKLREALLHDCFEEGILGKEENSTPIAQTHAKEARSALLVILDRFAGLESPVVNADEVHQTWWKRLIKPALLLDDRPSGTEHVEARSISLSRNAAKAARNLVVQALNSLAHKEDTSKAQQWLNELVELYIESGLGTYARTSLTKVLLAVGKSQAKMLFTTLDANLFSAPVETLLLLNDVIRTHSNQAYHIFSTPLAAHIMVLLDDISVNTQSSIASHELVWVSSALTTLSMLLVLAPSILEKHLSQLFVIFAKCLLWYDSTILHPETPTPGPEDGNATAADAETLPPAEDEAHNHPKVPLFQALLEYCTSLYGLFPANLLAFISSPVRWLTSQRKRSKRRRRDTRTSGTAFLQPPPGASDVDGSSGEATSTSADETGPIEPLPGETMAEATARRKAKSKAHGKGRRSKIQKQKKDAAVRAKKTKESVKQKEREKRRKQGIDETPSGLPADQSLSSSQDEAGVKEPEVRIDGPDGEEEDGATAEAEDRNTEHEDDSGASSADDEAQDNNGFAELDDGLLKLDWSLVRTLAEPYLSQHAVIPALLTSPEAEHSRNKLRFHASDSSDLTHEVASTRLAATGVSGTSHAMHPSNSSSALSNSTGHLQMPHLNTDDVVVLLQNTLIFENYQKNQLVSRLGTMLREHVVAGGAEADRQNLNHTIRFLRSQLQATQATLAQVRQETSASRDRLVSYVDSQKSRLETFREERKTWKSEKSQLEAELEDARGSVTQLSEKLAEAESKVFDLESEDKFRQKEDEKKEKAHQSELQKLRDEIERLKSQVKSTEPEIQETEK